MSEEVTMIALCKNGANSGSGPTSIARANLKERVEHVAGQIVNAKLQNADALQVGIAARLEGSNERA